MTWTDNSNDEDGFIVERSPNGVDTWTQVGAPSADATSFVDTSAALAMNTTYFYRVRAASSILGESGNSNVANATTAALPAVPTNLVATPSPTSLQISLTWMDNSGNETSFVVERSPNGTDTWTQIGTPIVNATSFTDTTAGLSVGTVYYYRVRATDALGDSGNSNVANATTASPPAAPTNLAATAATNAVQIDLTWTDNSSNEDGFIIERSPNGTDSWTQIAAPAADATSFSDTSAGLAMNTTYYYRVRATNADLGASGNSNVINATTASTPNAPGNLVATPVSNALQVNLVWTDNSNNETGFIIERSPNGTDTWAQVGTATVNETAFSDTTAGLAANTTYYYRVRANDALGTSANSNVAFATIDASPAAPGNLVATAATSALQINLTWTDNSSNEDGFVVERSPNGADTWRK